MTKRKLEADALADRLDAVFRQGAQPPVDTNPLVDMALRLSRAPRPDMPVPMAARIEAQVIDALRQQGAAQPALSRVHPRTAWQWLGVAAVILLTMIAGFMPAIGASVPGDLLYPAKQAIEQVELSLASSPVSRASLFLTHAERRGEEADTLLARGRFQAGLVIGAVQDMVDAASALTTVDLPADQLHVLQTRAAGLTDQLTAFLDRASQSDLVDRTSLVLAQSMLQAAVDQGLPPLLPPLVSPPNTVPVPAVTLTETPGTVPSETPAAAPLSTATPIPTAVPSVTLPPIPAADPTATGMPAEPSPGDDGAIDCSHPPPPNAPSLGWREHCEGGTSPSDVQPGQESAPGSSGNAPGRQH